MTLQNELREFYQDMNYSGKAYEGYYRMGLTVPFLHHIAPNEIGNLEYLNEINDLENICPIKDSKALNKIGGVLKNYIQLTQINDIFNLDWFESLEIILENNGVVNNTPVDFYLDNKDVFIKYCNFILGKEDYDFKPEQNDIDFAKKIALDYSKQQMNLVFNQP